jgi:DNA-binding GntR family transcriptional regulator
MRYSAGMTRIPRYQALAQKLRQGILSGRYPVGSHLPTELEICRDEDVSRHTAREALRILIEDRLVERRQGAGTRVIAAERPGGFVQPLGGPQQLMQYARDARLEVRDVERRALTGAEAARLEVEASAEDWLVLNGLRRRPTGEILADTELFVPPAYLAIEPQVRAWEGALQELIAHRWGVQPARIEQSICAEVLDAGSARRLHATEGTAALRTFRRYYDQQGRLIIASDSVHPADRFALQMTYHRGEA